MNKKYLITAGAIGAVVFGSVAAYQLLVKPAAVNQIEILLANLKANAAKHGDGTELTYGDVSVSGLTATIPNIHFKDGKTGMTGDIESAEISAIPGHIQSADFTNLKLSETSDGSQIEFTTAKISVDNLTFPADVRDKLLVSDVNFDSAQIEGMNAKVIDETNTVTFSIASAKVEGKTGGLIANEVFTDSAILVEPMNVKVDIPDISFKNLHIPADFDFMNTQNMNETLALQYLKTFAESSHMKAVISIEGTEIGSLEGDTKNVGVSASGFPNSGTSTWTFKSSATREQILQWVKTINLTADVENQIDEVTLTDTLDKLGLDHYELNVDVKSQLTKEGDAIIAMTYDFGKLGKLDINFDVAKLDTEKYYSLMTKQIAEGKFDPAVQDAELLAFLQSIEIKKFDLIYADGVLADFFLDMDPNMPRAQLAAMAPMMAVGMLKTEPSLMQPTGEALSAFVTNANKFEIHVAPAAPVAISELMTLAQSGKELGPLLGITVAGE